MKQIWLVLNCYGLEIMAYFNNIPEIRDNYKVDLILNYENLNNDSVFYKIKDADYLIMNNVKNYENLKPSTLKLYVKDTCRIIVTEFLRFSGFHPLKNLNSKNNMLSIYDESFEKSNTYDEYINYQIDKKLIIDNFNDSVEKLKLLDEQSDLKFFDFFMKNYKTKLLIRDKHHCTEIFMKHIVICLLDKMEIHVDPDCVNNLNIELSWGFKFRYSPILNCIKECLNLEFNDDDIDFYNKKIRKEDFYHFIKKSYDLPHIEREFQKFITNKTETPPYS
jgi:hypothetical protein